MCTYMYVWWWKNEWLYKVNVENTIIKQFAVIKKFDAYDFIAAANSQSHVMSQNTMHIKHNISWINDRHAPLKRKKT
jgi:hypothetical protein